MLPLKSLPALLRSRTSASTTPTTLSRLSTASNLRHHTEAASETTPSEASSTVVSQLEHEEKDLRERLVVLEEQRFMVQDMMKAAQAGRRFEEVGVLRSNLEELEGEIGGLKGKIGGVEQRWQGVYTNGSS